MGEGCIFDADALVSLLGILVQVIWNVGGPDDSWGAFRFT